MENCIFCKIVAGEIPSMRVYEDADCIATLDIGPATEGHTLIIPKKHAKDITEVPAEDLGKLFKVAAQVGTLQMERLGAKGFNVVQNNGTAAGQTVMHFHIHVIPRYENGPQVAAWDPTEPGFDTLGETLKKLTK